MAEEGHVQITEFTKEVFPKINWMLEDLFCQYGVAMPYFLLEYDFPDYSERPEWASGYYYNLDWGEWGYYLPWFNQLLWLLFDEADLPRWTMPDFSPASWDMFNSQISQLYEGGGETIISPSVGALLRRGIGLTYEYAKSDYEDSPSWTLTDPPDSDDELNIKWWARDVFPLQIHARQLYLEFDTISVSSVSTAKFVFTNAAAELEEVTANPTLYIYEHNFGSSVTSGDWTGGTKIKEREFSVGDDTSIELSIGTSYVNTGGYSRYRFTTKEITDLDYLDEPDGADRKQNINFGGIKLHLT